jgi:hypothetical protein
VIQPKIGGSGRLAVVDAADKLQCCAGARDRPEEWQMFMPCLWLGRGPSWEHVHCRTAAEAIEIIGLPFCEGTAVMPLGHWTEAKEVVAAVSKQPDDVWFWALRQARHKGIAMPAEPDKPIEGSISAMSSGDAHQSDEPKDEKPAFVLLARGGVEVTAEEIVERVLDSANRDRG